MAQMKKNPVSGKTVKTTTYSPLNPFKKDVKMVNERTTRKPTAKKAAAKPMSNTTKKAPAKPKPMETTRVGGIFNVPKKPKKTVY
jgi:hypothetical protein